MDARDRKDGAIGGSFSPNDSNGHSSGQSNSGDTGNSDNVTLPDTCTLDFTPSPEVLFLIKSHAKTISAINSINRKLEQLEVKVCDISRNASRNQEIVAASSANLSHANKCTNPANVLSDDSGGEYSRSTTNGTTDDDELMSLLDQIGKYTQIMRETQSQLDQCRDQGPSMAVNDVAQAQQLYTTGMQDDHRQEVRNENKRLTSGNCVDGHPSTTASGSSAVSFPRHHISSSPSAMNQVLNTASIFSPPIGSHYHQPIQSSHHVSHHLASSLRPPHPQHLQPHHQTSVSNSSLSALLFDPNVSRILNSLQEELHWTADDPMSPALVPSSRYNHATPLRDSGTQSYPPPQYFMRHSPNQAFNPIQQYPIGSFVPSQNLVTGHHQIDSSPHGHQQHIVPVSTATGGKKWEMNRALQLVQRRKKENLEAEYGMADQWLAKQMSQSVSSKGALPKKSVSTVTLRSPSNSTTCANSSTASKTLLTQPPSSQSTSNTSAAASSTIPSTHRIGGQRVTISHSSHHSSGNNGPSSHSASSSTINHPSTSRETSHHSRQSVRSYILTSPGSSSSNVTPATSGDHTIEEGRGVAYERVTGQQRRRR